MHTRTVLNILVSLLFGIALGLLLYPNEAMWHAMLASTSGLLIGVVGMWYTNETGCVLGMGMTMNMMVLGLCLLLGSFAAVL